MKNRTQPPQARRPRAPSVLRSSRTILWYGAHKFARDRTPLLAAALAYRTVFSLIPMLVLAVVAVRSFADPDALRNQVFDWFAISDITFTLPAGEPGGEDQVIQLAQFMDQFVDRAMERVTQINFTAITAVGVAILFYAALSLLIQIEQAFNAVYGATAGRRLMLRLTNYWSLLTLGSLALVISFAVSEYLSAKLRSLGGFVVTSTVTEFVTTVGVTWIVLIFAYVRMPTTRVRLRPAAAGAAVAAITWELAKGALTWFIATAFSGQVSVYGSLALIPLFLLWIQITWMIILVGLQIAYAIQNFSYAALLKAEDRRREKDPIIDPAIGVILMRDVARAFRAGKPRSLTSLADVAGISEVLALPVLDRLAEVNLLNRVEKGDEDAFSLARPAEDIPVNDILHALRELIPEPRDHDESRVLDRLIDTRINATDGLSLADLDGAQPSNASAQA